MRKRNIIFLLTAVLLCSNFGTYTAIAGTCPPHGEYRDVMRYAYTSITSHEVETPYHTANGEMIYETCTVTAIVKEHSVICGKCYVVVGGYTERGPESHSVIHN